MPETVIDLGKKVKAKYPGQYDDLPDADVGRKVKAKYPSDYSDFSDVSATPTAKSENMPWVSPDDWLYPLAEGARSGAEGVGNALSGAYSFLENAVRHPLDTVQAFTAPVSAGPQLPPAGPDGRVQMPPDPVLRTLGTIGRNVGALIAPGTIQQATPERNQEAQGFAGQTAASALAAKATETAPTVVNSANQLADAVRNGKISSALDEMAAANKARAMRPTTIQGKADAQAVAGEVSRTGGAQGLRGSTIDKNVVADFEKAGQRVGQVEDRLSQEARPEYQVSRDKILAQLDAAKVKLNIRGTSSTARPEAVTQIDAVRKIVAEMPQFLDFDQAIQLRRQFDDRASEAGAFGVNADTLKADISRGAADLLRGELNGLDPELKVANREYSIQRKMADMVKRRQLGETGKITSGLPGRGGILDDVLAGWAGNAMGGPVGGAIAEAVNLGRQTRGFANVKSNLQQALADMTRPNPPRPRALLGTGAPQLGTPANPAMEVTTGAPLIQNYGYPEAGTQSGAKNPSSRAISPTAADYLNAKRLGLSIADYMNSKR